MALVERHAPTSAAATAVRNGHAVVLGGFSPPPPGLPFFAVKIRSKRGKEWVLLISIDEVNRGLVIRRVDEFKAEWWEWWDGVPGGGRLIDGEVK